MGTVKPVRRSNIHHLRRSNLTLRAVMLALFLGICGYFSYWFAITFHCTQAVARRPQDQFHHQPQRLVLLSPPFRSFEHDRSSGHNFHRWFTLERGAQHLTEALRAVLEGQTFHCGGAHSAPLSLVCM